ncbi:MAG TPA: spore coat U domain-containing protein [Candidatus Elarobacter sp.]|nr:spore coat U domain-containing protein [Candidatus Elarobacter sp.]
MRRHLALCALLLLALPGTASASCSFRSIESLPFAYDPIGGAAATAAATMTVTCSGSGYGGGYGGGPTDVTVSLDAGTHAGPSATPWRKLANPLNGQTLNYNVYVDPAHATVWGDGTSGTATQSHAQTFGTFSLTLYGLIPAGQSVAAGSYSDTITATLTF